MQALYLTGKIEEAKAELATLKVGPTASKEAGEVVREKIRELEPCIQEASARAGAAISSKPDDYVLLEPN